MTTPVSADSPAAPEPVAPPTPFWLKAVPMLTGVLAGLGGYLTIRQANLSNEAIYWTSKAGLDEAKAADLWAQYQADSIKARIVETERDTAPAGASYLSKLDDESKKFRDNQPKLKADAEAREIKRDEDMAGGRKRLTEKDELGYAGMAVQLGIALASVAALVKKPMAFYGAVGFAIVGVGVTAWVLLQDWMH